MVTRAVSEIDRAVDAWNKADEGYWDFAPLAASIVGKRDGSTRILADRIKRSADTVEGYAKAWMLWEKLLHRFPANAEVWRSELSIGHFVAVGRKHFAKMGISLDDSANFLQRAVNENMKVEDLRTLLPATGSREEWLKSVSLTVKKVEKSIIYAPTLGISDWSYQLARKASEIYVRLMRRVIEREAGAR